MCCDLICQFICSIVHHNIKERVHLWNHEPRSILITRNNFPMTFKHHLHSAILKSENTKTLLLVAFIYKNPKNIIYHCFHHPCIIIYHHCIFIYCFASIIILISFSHIVLDNHLVRLRAQSNLLCLQEIWRRTRR